MLHLLEFRIRKKEVSLQCVLLLGGVMLHNLKELISTLEALKLMLAVKQELVVSYCLYFYFVK